MNVSEYLKQIKFHLSVYESKHLGDAINLIEKRYSSGAWIFLAGNGGSQSIVEHFATDWSKGIHQASGKAVKTFILNSSTSLSSAISNDLSYIESISLPLSLFANRQDLLILVSSSGKSPNILNAHNKAKELGIEVITLSGFGCSSQILDSDVSINIDSKDYQVIEDVHAIFGHLVLKYFVNKYSK